MEKESTQVSIDSYKEALPYPASEDSFINAVAASKYLTTTPEEEGTLIAGIQSAQEAQTNMLWSLEDANNQKILIMASLVTQIAGSKNANDLLNSQFFRKGVTNPVDRWNTMPEVSDVDKITKIKKDLEESISGSLWTLYKDQLPQFVDEHHFATYLFSKRDYVIRPNSYNESIRKDIKTELSSSK